MFGWYDVGNRDKPGHDVCICSRQPIEGTSGLRNLSHGQSGVSLSNDLDRDMHASICSNAAAGEFGEDLSGLGVEGDPVRASCAFRAPF